jgi:hypothetical protein
VSWVETRPIFGKGKLAATLEELGFNRVNTSAIERHNNTSRQHDRRQTRKSLSFSKEGRYHRWMRWLATTLYNFCWDRSTLRRRQDDGKVQHRSPAMAAGLSDHIWLVREWLLCPLPGSG